MIGSKIQVGFFAPCRSKRFMNQRKKTTLFRDHKHFMNSNYKQQTVCTNAKMIEPKPSQKSYTSLEIMPIDHPIASEHLRYLSHSIHVWYIDTGCVGICIYQSLETMDWPIHTFFVGLDPQPLAPFPVQFFPHSHPRNQRASYATMWSTNRNSKIPLKTWIKFSGKVWSKCLKKSLTRVFGGQFWTYWKVFGGYLEGS